MAWRSVIKVLYGDDLSIAPGHWHRAAAWSEEDARTYIEKQSGKHFHPEVVESFFKTVA